MYLTLDPAEDLAVLDAHLDSIEATGSTKARALHIMEYVHKQIGIPPKAHTGTSALALEYGNCYWQSVAFAALCRRAGIPARVVSLWGLEGMQHTVAEAWFGGAWHLHDTYWCNVFCCDCGVILSLEELRFGDTCFQCCAVEDGKLEPRDDYPTVGGQFEIINSPVTQVRACGVTTAFPLSLVMEDGGASVGSVDGSMWDCTGDEHGSVCYFLGDWAEDIAVHDVSIIGAPPGAYELTYYFVTNSGAGDVEITGLSGLSLYGVELTADALTIHCYVREPLATLRVSMGSGCATVDALRIAEY